MQSGKGFKLKWEEVISLDNSRQSSCCFLSLSPFRKLLSCLIYFLFQLKVKFWWAYVPLYICSCLIVTLLCQNSTIHAIIFLLMNEQHLAMLQLASKPKWITYCLNTYIEEAAHTWYALFRASGKVRGCDPALSTKNRTISHYSLFPALCRTFRVYLLKKPISYKISFENRNNCDELCVYKMI